MTKQNETIESIHKTRKQISEFLGMTLKNFLFIIITYSQGIRTELLNQVVHTKIESHRSKGFFLRCVAH